MGFGFKNHHFLFLQVIKPMVVILLIKKTENE
ncbi:hypothetical protein M621_20795 [Serratia plymuthica S13]|uniref:Uncharacterized protein n=1 Tax=Serratia plymuthica S13 TaxID=1348660 RepID=S4YS08_SERPL|nr:hypothetical protein M621_20795 [Serratia plymuthica S13]